MKMNAINSLILVLCTASAVKADCLYFDFYGSLESLPTLVHVRVIDSDVPSCNSFRDDSCKYRFSADVLNVLKGDVKSERLQFSYNYWLGCPGVDTFEIDKEYIFAIKEYRTDGTAELHGVNCGQWGVSATEIEKVRKALSQPKSKKK